MAGFAAPFAPLDPTGNLGEPAPTLSESPVAASPVDYYDPGMMQPGALQFMMAPPGALTYRAPNELSYPDATNPAAAAPALHATTSLHSLHSAPSVQSLTGLAPLTTPSSASFAAPPNTAVDGAWPAHASGLTPLFASFGADAQLAATPTRPGPMRTLSGSASMPGPAKRRSASGLSPGMTLPMTPFSPVYPYGRAVPAPKRVFHPSPSSAPALDVSLSKLPADAPAVVKSESARARVASIGKNGQVKPPRFKPTAEQLDVLVQAYQENKDFLSRQLDIRPKTLQIWFQNRRSKARERERKSATASQRAVPPPIELLGAIRGGTRGIDVDALRGMMHDSDPFLIPVPISVVAIASWTRILTPGHGLADPDLGMSLHISPPQIRIYVVHASDTFRLIIPIDPHAIAGVHAAANAKSSIDSLGIRFTLAGGVVRFHRWAHGVWDYHSDFTSGACSSGGEVEVSGDRDTMTPACMRIQSLLQAQCYPTPATADSFVHPCAPTFQLFMQAPALGHTSNTVHPAPLPLGVGPLGVLPAVPATAAETHGPRAHVRQRSLSQPALPGSFASGASTASSELTTPTPPGQVDGWHRQTLWPNVLPGGDDAYDGAGVAEQLPAGMFALPGGDAAQAAGQFAQLRQDGAMSMPAFQPFVPMLVPSYTAAFGARPAREGTASTDYDDGELELAAPRSAGSSTSSGGSADGLGGSLAGSGAWGEGFAPGDGYAAWVAEPGAVAAGGVGGVGVEHGVGEPGAGAADPAASPFGLDELLRAGALDGDVGGAGA